MLPPRRLLFSHIYISKGAAEMKTSDVGNDPFSPHMEVKICLTVRNDTGNI